MRHSEKKGPMIDVICFIFLISMWIFFSSFEKVASHLFASDYYLDRKVLSWFLKSFRQKYILRISIPVTKIETCRHLLWSKLHSDAHSKPILHWFDRGDRSCVQV